MKTKLKLLAASLLLSTINYQLSTALAQGTAFTYQGALNNSGSPATGLYDFQFSLSNAPSGGSQIGSTVTNLALGVTNGLFLTSLDFGAVFTGNATWLAISVRTNGEGNYVGLTPLQPLAPIPYAMYAASAGTASTATTAASAGSVSAANLVGLIPVAELPPSVLTNGASAVTLFGSFSGNGGGLTNVNATTVNNLNASNLWQLGGNNIAAGQFLGSTNNQPVEFRANGGRVLRLEPGVSGAGAPNVIGGSVVNFVSSGVLGATIGGGGTTNYGGDGTSVSNIVLSDYGTVGGGVGNTAGNYDTVAGGVDNTANGGAFNTVAGGWDNQAIGGTATVGGGNGNLASGYAATVSGGQDNVATNFYSTVGGGNNNLAGGKFSFAAGQNAQALHQGAFVWADSQAPYFASTASNQFNVRAGGGVRLVTSGAGMTLDGPLTGTSGNVSISLASSAYALEMTSNGVAHMTLDSSGNLECSGTVYSKGIALTSDRDAKENFTALDSRAVLAKVTALPLSEWNYKSDNQAIQHIGPMAQDFHAAFGLDGSDDQHISVVDEGGVALAAIQGLNHKLETDAQAKDAEIQALKLRLENLEQRMTEMIGAAK